MDYFYQESLKHNKYDAQAIVDTEILDCIEPLRQLGREQLGEFLSYRLNDCKKDEFEENLFIAYLVKDDQTCKVTFQLDEESKPTLVYDHEDEFDDCLSKQD